jgi:hypothetical protein
MMNGLRIVLYENAGVVEVLRWARVAQRHTLQFEVDALAGFWQQLSRLLAELPPLARCEIILGSPFAVWMLDTWPDSLAPVEFQAYLEHGFIQAFGSGLAAQGWQAATAPRARPGDSLLNAAIDRALFQQCQAFAGRHGLRLCSVRPLLAALTATVELPVDAVLAIREPGYLTLLACRDGGWQGFRTVRRPAAVHAPLAPIFEAFATRHGLSAAPCIELDAMDVWL